MQVSVGDVSIWFDVDGARLVADGDGMRERRTLVLLHGGPGYDHSYLKTDFGWLAADAQLVYIDQRGQGRSGRGDPQSWTLDRWADDVAAFCGALAIERPVLLGMSLGGIVALNAAIRHPGLASGLITVSSAAHVERAAIVARYGEIGGPAAADAARDFLARPDDEAAVAAFTTSCFPLNARKGLDTAKYGRAIRRPEVTAHFFRPGGECGRFDLRPGLGRCRVPTLMLHGEMDPIIPVAFARSTAAAFPDGVAKLIAYGDCSHDLMTDRPDEARAAIRTFLAALA